MKEILHPALAAVAALGLLAAASCGGGGSAPPCNNRCPQAGAAQCSGLAVQTCVADSNGCLAFSAPVSCGPARYCSAGGCVASIFGMHDPGGEHLMLGAGKTGWIVFTEKIGADSDPVGRDYTSWAAQGFGIVVRLNNGYEGAVPDGTLPCSSLYDSYAARAAAYAAASRGAGIWIIANEPNIRGEWPTCGTGKEPITTDLYARAFALARARIRAVAGHGSDVVVLAAVAPWPDDTSAAPRTGVDYLRIVLATIGNGNYDGIALHAYTQTSAAGDVMSEVLQPGTSIHQHFRVYRDLLGAIPAASAQLPVYLTEADPNTAGWLNVESGWVQNVYREIAAWNDDASHQRIGAVALYRWPMFDTKYGIANFPDVQADFVKAMSGP